MRRPPEKTLTLSDHRLALSIQNGKSLLLVYITYMLGFLMLLVGVPAFWCMCVLPLTIGTFTLIRNYREFRERKKEKSSSSGEILESPELFPVLIFTKNRYRGLYFADSQAEAHGYCVGLAESEILGGSEPCDGYLWPEDEQILRMAEYPEEVERALVNLAEKTERRRLAKEGNEP